jgi:hypothetical protein
MKIHATLRPLAGAALLAPLVFFAGCSTTTYTVQVDAIAKPTETGAAAATPQSYSIRSKNVKLDETSLRYKEVTDYVKTALSGKGMYEAPRPENADVVIDIDYGMDAPRVKFETMSTPIVMQTGGSYETKREERLVRKPDGTTEVIYVDVQVFVPGRTEFIGVREEVTPVIVYEKYLKVSARENKEVSEGRAPAEVWSVNVSAEDKSQELRKYIPILASATADYIGTNTKESKPVTIDEKDEVVKFIKKGM